MRRAALHSISVACALVAFVGVTTATQQSPEEIAVGFDGVSTAAILTGTVIAFGFFAVIAAVLIHLVPEYTRSTNQHVRSDPITTGLIGFGTFIGIVLVSVVLILTLIGALIGVPLLLALLVVSLVGAVIVDITIGRYLLAEFADRTEQPPATKTLWLAFVTGFVVTAIATSIPIVGSLIALALSSLGIGAIVQQIRLGSALSEDHEETVEEAWASSSEASGSAEPTLEKDDDWDTPSDTAGDWNEHDDDDWGAGDERDDWGADDKRDDDRSW